jgi:hypothetical protein
VTDEVKKSKTPRINWVEIWLSQLLDRTMDFFDKHWYGPLESVFNRIPTWVAVVTLPVYTVLLALPPLALSVLLFTPYVLVIVGILSLVGVL